ncbi:MAG: hypothetical protein EBZ60_04500 [Betaproteobacteria bacterium]|nr:hypothetical protein [Betaproteobacteria bacterium]
MTHHPLPQALSLTLLSLCLATPLGAHAKNPSPPPLQCEKDGKWQACDDQPALTKPKKALAFKAQGNNVTGEADKNPKKKKKKAKKTTKKKTKPSVTE